MKQKRIAREEQEMQASHLIVMCDVNRYYCMTTII